MSRSPDLIETSQCLCLASRRTARAITRRFDSALRVHGIRATQFSLLAALALKGPQPIGALADFIGADRTTLTRNVAIAQEHGLVEMGPGTDARSHIARVTARGRQILQKAFRDWQRTQTELTQSIGTEAADNLRWVSREPGVTRTSRESKR